MCGVKERGIGRSWLLEVVLLLNHRGVKGAEEDFKMLSLDIIGIPSVTLVFLRSTNALEGSSHQVLMLTMRGFITYLRQVVYLSSVRAKKSGDGTTPV